MSQKRQPNGDDDGKAQGSDPDEKRQKVPALRNVILEAVKMHKFQKFLSGLEPLIRKVVKEEVEVAFKKHLSKTQNCGKQIHPSTSRSLQLHFGNKLSLPIFTGSRIEGEEGSTIEVALVDTTTGEVVSSGPGSAVKVEIVVLEGDFEAGDDDGGWSFEEFNSNIVKERGGRRPLLTGDSILNLKEGTCMFGDLFFTDNSSWTRSRKFRLGARVFGDMYDEMRVREAKTEAFVVKDHRGELYKKHHPPSLVDEIWRLEKIGKDGAFHKRLIREDVYTVKDFLTLLSLDDLRLRNILGTGMSAKMWEVTVDHAQTCELGNQMYSYHPTSIPHEMGVVFNVVGQTLGVLFEGHYIPLAKLSESEKVSAHMLVKLAYRHWEEVRPFDTCSLVDGSPNVSGVSFPSGSAAMGSSYASQIPASHNLEEVGITRSNESPSDMVSSLLPLGGTTNLDYITFQGYDNMDSSYDQFSSFTDQVANSLNCDAEATILSHCSGDHMQYFDSGTFESQNSGAELEADLHTAVTGFLAMSAPSNVTSTTDKAQTRWTMLYSVLRWISLRRIVASKKSGAQEMKRYG